MLEIVIFSLIVLIFGILPGIWYFKRDKSLDKNKNKNKKINLFFVVLSIPLIIINSYVAFLVGKGSIEYIVGYVFFIPVVIILLFSLGKDGRNWRTRWNIIFYTSLVTCISSLGNLLSVPAQ